MANHVYSTEAQSIADQIMVKCSCGWREPVSLFEYEGDALWARCREVFAVHSTSAPPVFVFGSNLAGRHGKGAALFARQHRGAIYGCGVGPQGNSYAVPTKDARLRTLPLHAIGYHVNTFLIHAREHADQTFQLTPIGCGLAGYKPAQIAPMFKDAPPNVILPDEFKEVLNV